jgi:ATP-dependent DNA ligase
MFDAAHRDAKATEIMPKVESRLLLTEHIDARGVDLFRAACEQDLEGIVGKWKDGRDSTDGRMTSWVKIKNRTYSQAEGRHEFFEARRQSSPHRVQALTPQLALR